MLNRVEWDLALVVAVAERAQEDRSGQGHKKRSNTEVSRSPILRNWRPDTAMMQHQGVIPREVTCIC